MRQFKRAMFEIREGCRRAMRAEAAAMRRIDSVMAVHIPFVCMGPLPGEAGESILRWSDATLCSGLELIQAPDGSMLARDIESGTEIARGEGAASVARAVEAYYLNAVPRIR